MKKTLLAVIVTLLCYFSSNAQAISEAFDNVSTLATNGWVLSNLSSPTGTTGWFQGNTSVFNSQNGAANSYIAADQNNTGTTGTISNWLITPNRTFRNGDVVTFYTRTRTLTLRPDRLQVRMSTNGTSSNVGTSTTSVGDFTDLLLEINDAQALLTYPGSWTQYSITISGLTVPTSGRMAFRYYVTGAGSSGSNSDYIGIDNFVYTPLTCPTITVSPSTLSNGTAGVAYGSTSFSQSGGVNPTTYAVTTGSLPAGLTLSSAGVLSGTPTASGPATVTVTATNTTTGCTGSRSYTININCAASTATLSPFTPLCSNEAPVTLSGGSPAGGTFSGTGVSGGMFDPMSGTQVITYSYVDGFGCNNTATRTFTVNQAPNTVFVADTVCSSALPFTLTNATPNGGTYTGTGIDTNVFSPSAGTQTIKYVLTDANGCSDSTTGIETVNAAPMVSFDTIPATICKGSADIMLTGGMPAGGMYEGDFVANNKFSPGTEGKYLLSYTYTDPANSCPGYATQYIEVIICPLSVNEIANNGDKLLCYPNPSNGLLTLNYKDAGSKDINIRILDVQGRLMTQEKHNLTTGMFTKTYDLNNYPKGIYMIEVSGNSGRTYQKVILQ
jgi:hypothetical protein